MHVWLLQPPVSEVADTQHEGMMDPRSVIPSPNSLAVLVEKRSNQPAFWVGAQPFGRVHAEAPVGRFQAQNDQRGLVCYSIRGA